MVEFEYKFLGIVSFEKKIHLKEFKNKELVSYILIKNLQIR